MRRVVVVTVWTAVVLSLWCTAATAQRRGGGGGGFHGGDGAGISRTSAASGPYGGGSISTSSRGSVIGPQGSTGHAASGSGSYTTPRGSTVDYRGAAAGGTGAGGVSAGRYAGGVQVTTPNGQTATKVGRGGAAVGPEGNAVAGRSGAARVAGPNGSLNTRYQGGVAIGPQGAVGGRSEGGFATGPGGSVGVGRREGAAVGPYGAAAVGGRTVAAGRGTVYRSSAAITNQGMAVRRGFATTNCFTPNWYRRYPQAWFAAGWATGAVWRNVGWNTLATNYGYSAQPIYYDYGDSVVYQDDTVYYNGEPAFTTEQFSQQASALASTGRDAKTDPKDDWQPLGVFAMVQGDETTSDHIFQFAVNKQGILRGNYYNAATDSTEPLAGSVDPKTQRAAWTIGARMSPVYEAGVANLTKDETTILVHYSAEKTQQWTLVRIEPPQEQGGK